jgi:hypothetical protein
VSARDKADNHNEPAQAEQRTEYPARFVNALVHDNLQMQLV